MSSKMFMYFFSRKATKVFDENIPGFVSIELFNGQNYSFSAALKGYKWYQTMNILALPLDQNKNCDSLYSHLNAQN